MGWKYEVSAWLNTEGDSYQYIVVYGGESLFSAIIAMFKWRKKTGCLKLEIR